MKAALFALLVATCAYAADPTIDIKLDQAGYLPDAPKIALVAAASTAPVAFTVRRAASGDIAFRGTLAAPLSDPDTGDTVRAADFTAFREPGTYYLDVAGSGRSWSFAIGANVYARAYYLAMRSFYGQRCGTAVDLGPEFPGYSHAACHLDSAFHASSGKTGARPASRGWHDAGDYGRYVVNSGITTGTLLWTWELYAARTGKVALKLPESGNGTPDILNEIRWNLDWMLSMQDEDGGVWHKQTSEKFCGFVMPEADRSTSYVIGSGTEPFKTTCATADFAAVMAIAARAYRTFDAAYAARCLRAARAAFAWAERNPAVLFRNPTGVSTGAYGDRDCSDELLWAAAELHRTTGDDPYHRYFLDHYRAYVSQVCAPGWPSVAPMALWTYALGRATDQAAVTAITEATRHAADALADRAARNPYRHTLATNDYIWGSNSVAANQALLLLVAHQLQPTPRYRETALENLHYLLGRNAFSLSFVTQVGEHAFMHPHQRPSGAPGAKSAPWPGLLSGGPNHSRQDPAMKKLPDLPPARMYLDETESYASNEIAINWNAPLVFLLAAMLP